MSYNLPCSPAKTLTRAEYSSKTCYYTIFQNPILSATPTSQVHMAARLALLMAQN